MHTQLSVYGQQPRVRVTKIEALRIIQQINGPMNGIEHISDQMIRKLLPLQYEVIGMPDPAVFMDL